MSGPKEATNPLEMSDEDFLKMSGPPTSDPEPSAEEPEEDPEEEEPEEEPEAGQEEPEAEDGEDPEPEGDEPEGSEDPEPSDGDGDPEEEEEEEGEEPSEDGDEEPEESSEDPKEPEKKDRPKLSPKKGKKSDDKVEKTDNLDIDYEEFYNKIMAPFKANGKMIELKSPEEAITLMQMGANYTKKLQDLRPHRKVLLMLQNNELLDEDKLSYLIDLDKKHPEAIRKLVKDSGIDPMDIDVESQSDYRGGNHRVTDEQSKFQEAMDEVMSTDLGKETLRIIQSTWDDASKKVIWEQPEILGVIQEQRESGIYGTIQAEVDRLRTLGQIPDSVSFLQAYKQVGDHLQQQGLLGQPEEPQPSPSPAPSAQPVARGAPKPKRKVSNGDKAKAASNRRSTPRPSAPLVNPLEMSDEEFMKMDSLKNRL